MNYRCRDNFKLDGEGCMFCYNRLPASKAVVKREVISYLTSQNMTVEQMAKEVGVSHQAVRRWTRGKTLPTGTSMDILMDAITENEYRYIPPDCYKRIQELNSQADVIPLRHIGDKARADRGDDD